MSSEKGVETSIVFRNVSYSIEVDKEDEESEGFKLPCFKEKKKKVILDNVSGLVKGGEVSAILGASGAGKTSLLNVVACRIKMDEG